LILPIVNGYWTRLPADRGVRKPAPDLTMAVNLSALQFRHASLIRTVRETLERHVLEASCLILEITESRQCTMPMQACRILEQLHDMGVRISIRRFWHRYQVFCI